MIPAGFDLSLQRDNAVIFPLGLLNASLGCFQISRFDQQGHPAGKLTLDSSRRRGDPVFNAVLRQEVMELQSLLIVCKENVVANAAFSLVRRSRSSIRAVLGVKADAVGFQDRS